MSINQVIFPKLGHFWLDNGLVGLIKMLEEISLDGVEIFHDNEKLILTGENGNIQKSLREAYELLVERFYNVSTRKQQEEKTSYNFYYDRTRDQFFDFLKRKSTGIAGIIYNKAPRPTGGSIDWQAKIDHNFVFNGKNLKKKRGVLPDEYVYLQERLDRF